MVDHDHLMAGSRGLGERFEGGGARIEHDHELTTLPLQPRERVGVRAVALLQTIGNIEGDNGPEFSQMTGQKRTGGSAVDVVIGDDADRLAIFDRIREARRGLVHADQVGRVRQEIAQAGFEKRRGLVEAEATRLENAPDDLRQIEALAERQRHPLIHRPKMPIPPTK